MAPKKQNVSTVMTKSINSYFTPIKSQATTVPKQEQSDSSLYQDTLQGDFPLLTDFDQTLYSWGDVLKHFTASKQWKQIYEYVRQEYLTKKIYPPYNLLFNAFLQTPFDKLRVVIVGQDPYHQPGQAMGLCFSVPRGIKPPPSLLNIYKCIQDDPNINGFIQPNHGDLTKWAQQGVLLLNAILTVEGQEVFKGPLFRKTNFYIFTFEQTNINSTYILKRHHVLESVHPSPLSAHRGFLNCQHFSKVNEILKQKGQDEIDWNLD